MSFKLYRTEKEKKWFWFLSSMAVSILLLVGISPFAQLTVNWTASLHNHFFITVRHHNPPTKKGEFVYLAFSGHKYFSSEDIFMKKVVGIPGDQVESRGREIYLNGILVAIAKEKSRRGDPLEPLLFTGKIPEGKLLLLGEHKDSYDSRYKDIGLVDANNILGTGYAIF